MSSPEGLAPGSLLADRYRVERKIGAGGMGEIYEVTHLTLGRRFVAKTLRPEIAGIPEIAERFRREAQAAAGLAHANIVQVTDFGTLEGGSAFLVMEKLEGRSLGDELDRHGALALGRAVKIVCDVLTGLEVAHAAGIVHRDLKPSNVFLSFATGHPEVAKLLDFGLARLLDGERFARLTRDGQVVGTPGFLAPEQALGRPVDHRADIFAAGTLLFVTLTRALPYAHRGSADLLRAVVAEAPTPLLSLRPDMPPEIAHVVAKALAKNPDERFATAREMRDAIEGWATPFIPPESLVERPSFAPDAPRLSHPVLAAPPPPRTTTRSRRLVVLVIVSLVSLLCLAGAIGFYAYRKLRARPTVVPIVVPMPAVRNPYAPPVIDAGSDKPPEAGKPPG